MIPCVLTDWAWLFTVYQKQRTEWGTFHTEKKQTKKWPQFWWFENNLWSNSAEMILKFSRTMLQLLLVRAVNGELEKYPTYGLTMTQDIALSSANSHTKAQSWYFSSFFGNHTFKIYLHSITQVKKKIVLLTVSLYFWLHDAKDKLYICWYIMEENWKCWEYN